MNNYSGPLRRHCHQPNDDLSQFHTQSHTVANEKQLQFVSRLNGTSPYYLHQDLFIDGHSQHRHHLHDHVIYSLPTNMKQFHTRENIHASCAMLHGTKEPNMAKSDAVLQRTSYFAPPCDTLYPSLDCHNSGYRKNVTKETTGPLKAWLLDHRKNPYPTKAEKIMLAIITKMTMTQVSTWFANARRRLKKESGDNEASECSSEILVDLSESLSKEDVPVGNTYETSVGYSSDDTDDDSEMSTDPTSCPSSQCDLHKSSLHDIQPLRSENIDLSIRHREGSELLRSRQCPGRHSISPAKSHHLFGAKRANVRSNGGNGLCKAEVFRNEYISTNQKTIRQKSSREITSHCGNSSDENLKKDSIDAKSHDMLQNSPNQNSLKSIWSISTILGL